MLNNGIKKRDRNLAKISMPVLLLVATVAISALITEDAFARDGGRYSGGGDTGQAASVDNECLNPILDSNSIDNLVDVGNCAGTVSQQDESGQAGATTTHQTANPTIELQRSTTTPPSGLGSGDCEGCFPQSIEFAEHFEAFINTLNTGDAFTQFNNGQGVSSVEEICQVLSGISSSNDRGIALVAIGDALNASGLSSVTVNSITECLTAFLRLTG
jgi:hypothetical protein